MLDRFFVPGDWPSDVVVIDEAEAHHLAHVLRKQRGDHVEVFDGLGRSAVAKVITLGRREVEVRILPNSQVVESPSGFSVWIAAAAPKGERLKSMVEKLTEIGVERIILLSAERSVVHPREAKVDKLEQAAISACKQCRRNTLPVILQASSIDEALRMCGPATALWVADQKGAAPSVVAADSMRRDCCFIGPEGGFTPAELESLTSAGARAASFGPHVLRIETAAILAAGWLMSRNRAE